MAVNAMPVGWAHIAMTVVPREHLAMDAGISVPVRIRQSVQHRMELAYAFLGITERDVNGVSNEPCRTPAR